MNPVEYPWPWLADSLGGNFVVRHPWIDELATHARRADLATLLIPESAGALAGWETWLVERLDAVAPLPCLRVAGDIREVIRSVADHCQVGDGAGESFEPRQLPATLDRLLARCKAEMPHVDTLPLVIADPGDECANGLRELVRAQRALGYNLVRPVLLRRTVPPGRAGEVVRFGQPEWTGNLSALTPLPSADPAFWTRLYLAMTVVWETGASPALAAELWDTLTLEGKFTIRDYRFDGWLDQELNNFAARQAVAAKTPFPDMLVFGPRRNVPDEWWQAGLAVWQGDGYDASPLWVRARFGTLGETARESLRRRRLTNIPMVRWLAAWATSIEEGLRVCVLEAGTARFFDKIGKTAPRRTLPWLSSRWDELDRPDEAALLDRADFGDLADFVDGLANLSGGRAGTDLWTRCRWARNRIVHERRVSAADFTDITNALERLSQFAGEDRNAGCV